MDASAPARDLMGDARLGDTAANGVIDQFLVPFAPRPA